MTAMGMINCGEISTANVADACVRLALPLRWTTRLRPLTPGVRAAGRVLPVRHHGTVDVFLEILDGNANGAVLVVDNQGRVDEGCIGDLVAIEMQHAGVSGIVIWGAHRDSKEIAGLGMPLYSLGACPLGPLRLEPRSDDTFERATIEACRVTAEDYVVADDDGVIFFPQRHFEPVVAAAMDIRAKETRQAAAVARGQPLREQLQFSAFRAKRERDPNFTFREHLRAGGGEIEQ